MGRRITRKQLKQDEFISTADTVVHWVIANWRPFAVGLAALCFVIVAWWAGTRWTGSRAEHASFLLHQATAAVDAVKQGGDAAAAEAKLQEVVDRYGRTEQADVARVLQARLRIDTNNIEGARSLLVEVSERRGGDAIGRVATLDLVRLQIATGQAPEVAPQLEAMVSGEDVRLPRDVALYELGELYSTSQDPERARSYYQRLVAEFPESPYRPQASQRLAELG
jgi:predicted negative regulator of RcsB-dependent stress response